jgi:uncharacterized protein
MQANPCSAASRHAKVRRVQKQWEKTAMLLPITLTFTAAAALLNIWLGMRVARMRMAHGVLHGDGGNADVMRRMRAHSNFVEYTPFVLILTGVVELAQGSSTWLWFVALVYIVGRVLHAFGMDKDFPSRLRQAGIMVTMLTMVGLAAVALYTAYSAPGRDLPPAMGLTA